MASAPSAGTFSRFSHRSRRTRPAPVGTPRSPLRRGCTRWCRCCATRPPAARGPRSPMPGTTGLPPTGRLHPVPPARCRRPRRSRCPSQGYARSPAGPAPYPRANGVGLRGSESSGGRHPSPASVGDQGRPRLAPEATPRTPAALARAGRRRPGLAQAGPATTSRARHCHGPSSLPTAGRPSPSTAVAVAKCSRRVSCGTVARVRDRLAITSNAVPPRRRT